MKTLALEFSTRERSAAVFDGGRLLGVAGVGAGGGRGVALELVIGALERAGVGRDDIGGIAVSLGPGSFTGIRVAISLATGWRFGRGVDLWGIPTFAVLAAGWWSGGGRGEAALAVPAQRGEHAVRECHADDRGWAFSGATTCLDSEGLRSCAGRVPVLVCGAAARGSDGDFGRVIPRAEAMGHLFRDEWRVSGAEALEPVYPRPAEFVRAPAPRFDVPMEPGPASG